jgi:transcriptional antiterminator
VVNQAVLATRLERLREYLSVLSSVMQYDVNRFVQDPFIITHGVKSLMLTIMMLTSKKAHGQTDANPISGRPLPCDVQGKRAKGHLP